MVEIVEANPVKFEVKNVEPPEPSVSESAAKPTTAQKNDEFIRKVIQARMAKEQKVSEIVKPELTTRQSEQLRAEQQAGRKAVAKHEAASKVERAPKPKHEIEQEGRTTPVFRPSDYVPDVKKPAVDTSKLLGG